MTVWKVLKREGINAHGYATMPEFFGNGDDDPGRQENETIGESPASGEGSIGE